MESEPGNLRSSFDALVAVTDPVAWQTSARACCRSLLDAYVAGMTLDRVMECLHAAEQALNAEAVTPTTADLLEILLDYVWVLDTRESARLEVDPTLVDMESVDGLGSSTRSLLAELVQQLRANGLVSIAFLKERLESDFMEAARVIASKQAWDKRVIRINTAMLYKQQKFNLMREESEGYAKVITELHQWAITYRKDPKERTVLLALDCIFSLIGYFDLDPNHSLDILLGLFIENVDSYHSFYLQLLAKSPWGQDREGSGSHSLRANHVNYQSSAFIIANLLGYHLDHHRKVEESGSVRRLFLVVSLLIRDGFITLDDIYPHLTPDDADLGPLLNVHERYLRDKAAGFGQISLAGGKKSLEKSLSASSIRLASLNQKAILLETLLYIGNLPVARTLFIRCPQLIPLRPSVVKHACRLLHYLVEPVYKLPRHGSQFSPFPIRVLPDAFMDSVDEAWLTRDLEQCQTVVDVVNLIVPLLTLFGPHLSLDIAFATKICRIMARQIKFDAPTDTMSRIWLRTLTNCILPTLSADKSNTAFVLEVWVVLRKLHYQIRYSIYAEWKATLLTPYPELDLVRAEVTVETKKILRRISKDNYRQFGRGIGKWSHNNPLILFTAVLDQLMVYENLILPVLDSLKYVTEFGLDVLVFLLIDTLADPKKTRLKDDGTNLALWLNSMAVFADHLFKKNPNLEMTGILEYVYYQVLDGNPFDLIVLKELVTKMTGEEQVLEGMSEHQVYCMTGSVTLRQEAMNFGQNSKATKSVKHSTQRLLNSLLDSGKAIKLAIMVGKQRGSCIFNSTEGHLKALGSLFDQVHETLLQYGEFLTANLDVAKLTTMIPSLTELFRTFQLEPEVAWFLYRRIASRSTMLPSEPLSELTENTLIDSWNRRRLLLVDELITIMPSDANLLKPELYLYFWEHTAFDVSVPAEYYATETGKLKSAIQGLGTLNADDQNAAAARKRKDRERYLALETTLQLDLKQHKDHFEKIKQEFVELGKSWFTIPATSDRSKLVSVFLQYCVRPRCLFSAQDALYCAWFILLLHETGVPNFSTLVLFDRIFNDIACSVFCCSQNEAVNYGRYVKEIMSEIHRWHKDPATYEEKGTGNCRPGLRKRWPRKNDLDIVTQPEDCLPYEDFRHVVHKWHARLNKAFVTCIESTEYLKMRNAILVLDKISDHFPIVEEHGNHLARAIRAALEKEKREDIKALLNRYDAALQKSKTRLVKEENFHIVTRKNIPKSEGEQSESATNDASIPKMPKDQPVDAVEDGEMQDPDVDANEKKIDKMDEKNDNEMEAKGPASLQPEDPMDEDMSGLSSNNRPKRDTDLGARSGSNTPNMAPEERHRPERPARDSSLETKHDGNTSDSNDRLQSLRDRALESKARGRHRSRSRERSYRRESDGRRFNQDSPDWQRPERSFRDSRDSREFSDSRRSRDSDRRNEGSQPKRLPTDQASPRFLDQTKRRKVEDGEIDERTRLSSRPVVRLDSPRSSRHEASDPSQTKVRPANNNNNNETADAPVNGRGKLNQIKSLLVQERDRDRSAPSARNNSTSGPNAQTATAPQSKRGDIAPRRDMPPVRRHGNQDHDLNRDNSALRRDVPPARRFGNQDQDLIRDNQRRDGGHRDDDWLPARRVWAPDDRNSRHR